MHEYDVTLKILLRGSAKTAMRKLTGVAIDKWLDIELPKMENPRVDLLGEASDGTLVHLELQSINDAGMPLRMAEYALGVYRLLGKFPRQIVLYVGEAAVRMENRLSGPGIAFRYEVIDIRELDGDHLIASEEVGDNVLAILTQLRDQKSAVRQIIGRMSDLESNTRDLYLGALLILAGLRGLEELVEKEARKVPVLNDILEHKVLGREFKKGVAQGIEQGIEKGIEKGIEQERRQMLRRLIEKRFGAIPAWAEKRITSRSAAELEQLSVRLLDAAGLEDLLK